MVADPGIQRADTADQPSVIQSLHRIKALARQMREALLAEDLDGFGELLALGWREKKCLSRKISSTAIDRWYEAARRAGALGGKIAGAGGGGFLLLFVEPEQQPAVLQALDGLLHVPFQFESAGSQIIFCEPGVDYQEEDRNRRFEPALAGVTAEAS